MLCIDHTGLAELQFFSPVWKEKNKFWGLRRPLYRSLGSRYQHELEQEEPFPSSWLGGELHRNMPQLSEKRKKTVGTPPVGTVCCAILSTPERADAHEHQVSPAVGN